MILIETLAILLFGIGLPSLILLSLIMWKDENDMGFNDIGKVIGGFMGFAVMIYIFTMTFIGIII